MLGSAFRALDVSPQFDAVLLFELNPSRALELDDELQQRYPGRGIRVVSGDCNKQVVPALSRLHPDFRFAARSRS